VDDRDDLALELAKQGLTVLSPEEVPILEAVGPELVAAPDAAPRGDGSLGFGLPDVSLATVAVAAAKEVVVVLIECAKKYAVDEGTGLIGKLVAKLRLHGKDGKRVEEPSEEKAKEPILEPEDLERARNVAYTRAVDSGLDDAKAGLLADAIVGALATPS